METESAVRYETEDKIGDRMKWEIKWVQGLRMKYLVCILGDELQIELHGGLRDKLRDERAGWRGDEPTNVEGELGNELQHVGDEPGQKREDQLGEKEINL